MKSPGLGETRRSRAASGSHCVAGCWSLAVVDGDAAPVPDATGETLGGEERGGPESPHPASRESAPTVALQGDLDQEGAASMSEDTVDSVRGAGSTMVSVGRERSLRGSPQRRRPGGNCPPGGWARPAPSLRTLPPPQRAPRSRPGGPAAVCPRRAGHQRGLRLGQGPGGRFRKQGLTSAGGGAGMSAGSCVTTPTSSPLGSSASLAVPNWGDQVVSAYPGLGSFEDRRSQIWGTQSQAKRSDQPPASAHG